MVEILFNNGPLVALFLFGLAILFFLASASLSQRSGMPGGQLVYTDSGTQFTPAAPLFSKKYQLVGKPDYIVRERSGHLTPIEYKSAKAPKRPYDSHVLQLATYCLLVQEHYGVRPQYGLIRYSDRTFKVAYTLDLEEELLEIVDEMRQDLFADDVSRSHNEWHRCQGCGFKDVCDESLL